MVSEKSLVDTKVVHRHGAGSIKLSVVIGDAQVGGTSVSKDGSIIKEGAIENLEVATDEKVAVISCVTRVKDINPRSNHTSVSHIFMDSAGEQPFPYEITVSEEGGYALYVITFVLLKG